MHKGIILMSVFTVKTESGRVWPGMANARNTDQNNNSPNIINLILIIVSQIAGYVNHTVAYIIDKNRFSAIIEVYFNF